jgi:outer membrane protein TolC
MLQIEPSGYFDILIPDLDNLVLTDKNFNTDSVYYIASQTLPRLKAIDYELQATKKQIAAARGHLAPGVSLGGALFTGYYKVISETATEQASFADQLRNNNSQAVFMSVNIPIFNNYTTGRNIKLAKIRKNDAELRLELEKNDLYSEIENACMDYNRVKDEYSAASANLEYNMKSFTAVEKKFESGLVDVTDYSAAKTNLFSAETNVLRTKLQLLIRKATIQFYTSGEYESRYFEE